MYICYLSTGCCNPALLFLPAGNYHRRQKSSLCGGLLGLPIRAWSTVLCALITLHVVSASLENFQLLLSSPLNGSLRKLCVIFEREKLLLYKPRVEGSRPSTCRSLVSATGVFDLRLCGVKFTKMSALLSQSGS